MNNSFSKVYSTLKRYGLLLESDKFLPSVVGIVTGEKILSTWWSHKKGHEIFNILSEISEKDDILLTKMISGKVTFIYKNLWLEFLTVANSNEPWQFNNLSVEAQALLKSIHSKGFIQTEKLPKDFFSTSRKMGDVVRELEKKILVCSYQTHTEQGFHAKVIENWEHWVQRKKIAFKKRIYVQDAKNKFEHLIFDLNKTFGGNGRLPWN